MLITTLVFDFLLHYLHEAGYGPQVHILGLQTHHLICDVLGLQIRHVICVVHVLNLQIYHMQGSELRYQSQIKERRKFFNTTNSSKS